MNGLQFGILLRKRIACPCIPMAVLFDKDHDAFAFACFEIVARFIGNKIQNNFVTGNGILLLVVLMQFLIEVGCIFVAERADFKHFRTADGGYSDFFFCIFGVGRNLHMTFPYAGCKALNPSCPVSIIDCIPVVANRLKLFRLNVLSCFVCNCVHTE